MRSPPKAPVYGPHASATPVLSGRFVFTHARGAVSDPGARSFQKRNLAVERRTGGRTVSPNNAMVPIPANVTTPANAGLAPFASMAHLGR